MRRDIPFMRYKWWFLGFLTLVTVVALAVVFIVGLDFGIDFKGGVRVQVGLEQGSTVDNVRSVVSAAGVQNPVVQSVSGAAGADSYMITAQHMPEELQNAVLADLDAQFTVKEGSIAVDEVGASFGAETTRRALIAIALAVVVIVAYLSFRFEFKFAIPGIVALVHDLALTMGIYAAGHRLVNAATMAAILTILGYSVHDTIVIFDRMRDNSRTMKKETYGQMVDRSIRQTIVRSINTSVALLLPLLAILIFGGPTLKDFALALSIGTVAGTYSSLFVAAPLVVLWKEREPRYRKLLLAAASAEGGQMAIEAPDMAHAETPAAAAEPAAETAAVAKADQTKPKGPGGGAGGKKVSSKHKQGKTSKRPAAKGGKRKSR